MTPDGVRRTPFEPRTLRRAQPLNRALPATWKWIAGLPADVRPVTVLDQFPRIANALARAWSDPPAFAVYLDSLLYDRRGGRRGFPREIKRELLSLRSHYCECHGFAWTALHGDMASLPDTKR